MCAQSVVINLLNLILLLRINLKGVKKTQVSIKIYLTAFWFESYFLSMKSFLKSGVDFILSS